MKEITSTSQSTFAREFNIVAKHVHRIAQSKGWWDDERSNAEQLALVHSEVSEVLEALRVGNPPSQKIPNFDCAEEECADVVIRIMDMAAANGWDIGGAIVAKIAHNKTRPHKHGKLF